MRSRREMLAISAAAAAAAAQPLSREARMKAPLTKPNGLNLIVLVADTTRWDHLGAYGSKRVKTPGLDRLAAEGTLFENAYADGLPTIPCRRVYHTGRSILREKRNWWRPLDPEDITLSEAFLKAGGVTTGLIADT